MEYLRQLKTSLKIFYHDTVGAVNGVRTRINFFTFYRILGGNYCQMVNTEKTAGAPTVCDGTPSLMLLYLALVHSARCKLYRAFNRILSIAPRFGIISVVELLTEPAHILAKRVEVCVHNR